MTTRAKNEAMNEAKTIYIQVNILKKLENNYVIKYYESFNENNNLNIIMEYCEGGDLSQYIKGQFNRPISEHKVWKFFVQITMGLNYIHSQKILHRDIKTMNVFLTKDENVRLLLILIPIKQIIIHNNIKNLKYKHLFYISINPNYKIDKIKIKPQM